MAKQTLPVNFKDDILDPSMSGKRKYRLIDNGDGTVSFEDVTTYTQAGSDYGAGQINATNKAVNESCDKADVIDDLDDIAANQANGKIAGAKAVAELNDNIDAKEPIQNRGNRNGYYYKAGYNCFMHITDALASDAVTALVSALRPISAVSVSGMCRNISTGKYYPCVGSIAADGTWNYLSALESIGAESVYYIYSASNSIDRRSNFRVWLTGAWSTNTNGA